jgi:hypothetical protein
LAHQDIRPAAATALLVPQRQPRSHTRLRLRALQQELSPFFDVCNGGCCHELFDALFLFCSNNNIDLVEMKRASLLTVLMAVGSAALEQGADLAYSLASLTFNHMSTAMMVLFHLH